MAGIEKVAGTGARLSCRPQAAIIAALLVENAGIAFEIKRYKNRSLFVVGDLQQYGYRWVYPLSAV